MRQVKEINKNRKAQFKRLLVEYVNNRIDATAVLGRSYIYKNLLGLAEQYIAHSKRDIMSCETQDEINDNFISSMNVHTGFISIYRNSIITNCFVINQNDNISQRC